MEIEIRAFIDDVENFKKKVEKIGGKFEKELHIIDYWFCENNFNKFDQVKQDNPGSYGLRIRREFNEGKERVELNCKVLEREHDHNAFHEYEVTAEDYGSLRKILESLGFKNFCTVDKRREVYSLGRCSINIENIKGFRPAVELEIIDDSNHEAHKEYMKELLKNLDIMDEDKIEKSITFLYMKEHSFKN